MVCQYNNQGKNIIQVKDLFNKYLKPGRNPKTALKCHQLEKNNACIYIIYHTYVTKRYNLIVTRVSCTIAGLRFKLIVYYNSQFAALIIIDWDIKCDLS